MSKTQTELSGVDVAAFVERNTMPGSKWLPEEEIVWVLSWYGGLDCAEIREALDRAVSAGDLVVEGSRYTSPALHDSP